MSGTDAPAAAWLASGAASLTGLPAGPGLVPPPPLLARIAHLGAVAGIDPWAALTERAAVAGLRRAGQVSCGGGTRLLPAEDGWVAVSLVRPEDVDAVPAWLELDDASLVSLVAAAGGGPAGGGPAHGDPAGGGPADPGAGRPGRASGAEALWPRVAAVVAERPVRGLVERATLLGLPVAAVGEAAGPVTPVDPGGGDARGAVRGSHELPGRWTSLGPAALPVADADAPPLVVDLSSLWAGPLCARTLAGDGAVVVKVEATDRPDGARRGPALFYDRLHAGHRAVALDVATGEGRRALLDLVRAAEVVIEASRPRALAQLGIEPAALGPTGPRAWVSITGHGREGGAATRVGFGDDAAAAGGLVAPTTLGPAFVADAVADPLTGLVAAVAARAGVARGGRWLVDVPLATVAAWVAAHPDDDAADEVAATEWRAVADPPTPGPVGPAPARAPAVGADTAVVLAAVRDGTRLAR